MKKLWFFLGRSWQLKRAILKGYAEIVKSKRSNYCVQATSKGYEQALGDISDYE